MAIASLTSLPLARETFSTTEGNIYGEKLRRQDTGSLLMALCDTVRSERNLLIYYTPRRHAHWTDRQTNQRTDR